MASRRYSDFVPKWARSAPEELLADTPSIGEQPAFAPRLPIRLLPRNQGHSITAITLSQVVSTTQKILNYASYEVVHGSVPGFADLRSAEDEVLDLAKLEIEPFEEGSFVIPARLSEREVEVNQRSFTGAQVLARFVEAMDGIGNGHQSSVSIGLIQAVEDLGRITRREAAIEYSAIGIQGSGRQRSFLVDEHYVQHVTRVKAARRSTTVKLDALEGIVTAVDLTTFKFSIQIAPKTVIKGSYESIVADKMANSLGERVKVEGVVQFVSGMPNFIRTFSIESLD